MNEINNMSNSKGEKKKVAIIGAGPAGLSAAIYCARAGHEVTVYESNAVGGVVADLKRIDNIAGLPEADGAALAATMYAQAKSFGVNFLFHEVIQLFKVDNLIEVDTDFEDYRFDAVIIAVGSKRKTLGIEKDYLDKGASYCAVCDGFFYKGKVTAVFGQGNTAVNDALYLSNIASKVYLINVGEKLTADSGLIAKLKSIDNIVYLGKTSIKSLHGNPFLQSITIFDLAKKAEQTLDVDGLFIALGGRNSKLSPELRYNKKGIVTRNGVYTSMEGVFAAGDCVAGLLKQVVSAFYTGAKCSEAINEYFLNKK